MGQSSAGVILLLLTSHFWTCAGFSFTSSHTHSYLLDGHLNRNERWRSTAQIGAARRWQPSLSLHSQNFDASDYDSFDSLSGNDEDERLRLLQQQLEAKSRGQDTRSPQEVLEGKGGPPPFREEHGSGASRFRDLLARARQGDPPVSGDTTSPPATTSPLRQRLAVNRQDDVQPRRLYSGGDDRGPDTEEGAWGREERREERMIGSPDLPDPALRNEMPGLGLPSETGGEGESGGSRFARMMSQAQVNEQRRDAGMGPRVSPRSPGAEAPQKFLTRDEKQKAMRAAVERQQKLMAKSKGIDLDDPTLEGPELTRRRALSRAQAEAQAGGYVPSSSAADDYLDALKADSRRKTAAIQNKLSGRPEPEPQLEDEATGERGLEPIPQRRTKASFSVQNESDAYIAALSGIKVSLKDNPYTKGAGSQTLESPSLQQPAHVQTPPPRPVEAPAKPKPPMSYSERLKAAREDRTSDPKKVTDHSADTAPSPRSSLALGASEAASSAIPTTFQPSRATYADKLRQARETSAKKSGLGNTTSQVQGREHEATTGDSRPSHESPRVSDGGARSQGGKPSRMMSTSNPFEADESGAEPKIMKVMDLLSEHKTSGLVGEDRVGELRDALHSAREALRAEMWGQSSPVDAEQPKRRASATIDSKTEARRATAIPASPRVNSSSMSEGDRETLSRCAALLQAHIHQDLGQRSLKALGDALAGSLEVINKQAGDRQEVPPQVTDSPLTQVPAVASADVGVPSTVGDMQSLGGILADMRVGAKPDTFEAEHTPESSADNGDRPSGWTDGSLEGAHKALATKSLGYLLKHRGGKGYGRGRVKGREAEDMVCALAELTEVLCSEMVED